MSCDSHSDTHNGHSESKRLKGCRGLDTMETSHPKKFEHPLLLLSLTLPSTSPCTHSSSIMLVSFHNLLVSVLVSLSATATASPLVEGDAVPLSPQEPAAGKTVAASNSASRRGIDKRQKACDGTTSTPAYFCSFCSLNAAINKPREFSSSWWC